MFDLALSILIMSLFSAIAMIAEHYVPWGRAKPDGKWNPIINYAIGLLSILIPVTVLAIYQRENIIYFPFFCILSFWADAVISGCAVAGCHFYDDHRAKKIAIIELNEREKLYREQLDVTRK